MSAPDFVSLAELLRAPLATETHVLETQTAAAVELVPDREVDALRDAVRDAKLFRARLHDTLEDAAARLLRDLAGDVLARELRLEPCDLAAIVARVGNTAPVLRVRVAPGEERELAGVAVLPDASLQSGDAVLEVTGGLLDARLGVRLATVLEAFA